MYGGHAELDGKAAFSGGGFMPSLGTQTAEPCFTSAKNRNSKSKPLTPTTVKQINEAFQSSKDKTNFLIDGVDVDNVKFVGMMLNKSERVTDVTFVIDDGTGRIDCYRCVNEAVDTRELGNVQDGMYVSVHGHLKGFQGKKQMMVCSIRLVADYNEIACHFADCIYVHCYNTRIQDVGLGMQFSFGPSDGNRSYSLVDSNSPASIHEMSLGLHLGLGPSRVVDNYSVIEHNSPYPSPDAVSWLRLGLGHRLQPEDDSTSSSSVRNYSSRLRRKSISPSTSQPCASSDSDFSDLKAFTQIIRGDNFCLGELDS